MSTLQMPSGYADRFSTAKKWERILFRTQRYIQSPELNEVQLMFQDRVQRIASALFKDGDRISGCDLIITLNDDGTASVRLLEGALYLQGAVRDLSENTIVIPAVGTYRIGVRATKGVLTELEDPTLRDPIKGTRAYNEKGAARLTYAIRWGWEGDQSDDDFFPVYTIVDGSPISSNPPPQLDAVTEALAVYDRDANGNYVVTGCSVTALGLANGLQSFSISEGVVNVLGYKITRKASSRLAYAENPDLQVVNAEPHVYTDTTGTGGYNCIPNHGPLASLTSATITVEVTENVTHGGYAGVSDALANNSVASIQSVKQGGTTYVAGTDFKLTNDQVDWSPSGGEPLTGTNYSVTYRYLKTIPGAQLAPGRQSVLLTGGVIGSTVLLNYTWKLPRIDAVVIDKTGLVTLYQGVSSAYSPGKPQVPASYLLLGFVSNNWGLKPTVLSDDVVVTIKKAEIQDMKTAIGNLFDLMAQEQLLRAAASSSPVSKRGIIVDPFGDDTMRDPGLPQTAACISGILQLGIDTTVVDLKSPSGDPSNAVTGSGTTKFGWQLPYTLSYAISQLLVTGSSKINPYQAFDVPPAQVTLDPPVDAWADYSLNISYQTASLVQYRDYDGTVYNNADAFVANRIATLGFVIPSSVYQTVSNYSTFQTVQIPYMRSRDVKFTIEGFSPLEQLSSMTFDGLPVVPVAA
jgi:hypothetical protein